MVEKAKLRKFLRTGLTAAAGKSLDEATEIVASYLDLLLEEQVSPPRIEPTAPKLIVVSDEPIAELAPIASGAPQREDKTRIWWEIQDLQNKVLKETPADMTIKIEGKELKLLRIVQQLPGVVSGVMLAYAPAGADSTTPIPRITFWCTDEKIQLESALEKIHKDAEMMYKPRKGPIRQGTIIREQPQWVDATGVKE